MEKNHCPDLEKIVVIDEKPCRKITVSKGRNSQELVNRLSLKSWKRFTAIFLVLLTCFLCYNTFVSKYNFAEIASEFKGIQFHFFSQPEELPTSGKLEEIQSGDDNVLLPEEEILIDQGDYDYAQIESGDGYVAVSIARSPLKKNPDIKTPYNGFAYDFAKPEKTIIDNVVKSGHPEETERINADVTSLLQDNKLDSSNSLSNSENTFGKLNSNRTEIKRSNDMTLFSFLIMLKVSGNRTYTKTDSFWRYEDGHGSVSSESNQESPDYGVEFDPDANDDNFVDNVDDTFVDNADEESGDDGGSGSDPTSELRPLANNIPALQQPYEDFDIINKTFPLYISQLSFEEVDRHGSTWDQSNSDDDITFWDSSKDSFFPRHSPKLNYTFDDLNMKGISKIGSPKSEVEDLNTNKRQTFLFPFSVRKKRSIATDEPNLAPSDIANLTQSIPKYDTTAVLWAGVSNSEGKNSFVEGETESQLKPDLSRGVHVNAPRIPSVNGELWQDGFRKEDTYEVWLRRHDADKEKGRSRGVSKTPRVEQGVTLQLVAHKQTGFDRYNVSVQHSPVQLPIWKIDKSHGRRATYTRKYFHLNKTSGFVTANMNGFYWIYAQLTTYDRASRWAFGIFVNDNIQIKCINTERDTASPSYNLKSDGAEPDFDLEDWIDPDKLEDTTSRKYYQHCHTGSIVYLRRHDRVSIKMLYGSKTILLHPAVSFFGLKRMS